MQFIATGAALPQYKLVTYNRYREVLAERYFNSQEELAEAACSTSWYIRDNQINADWYYDYSKRVRAQKAFSPKNKQLNIEELIAWGKRLQNKRYMSRYLKGYVFRKGSVPGIGGWRHGPSTRPYRVQNERRATELVVYEDGEVAARTSRIGYNLPDSWDGRPRTFQRCWKSQHKGRKNWDRKVVKQVA